MITLIRPKMPKIDYDKTIIYKLQHETKDELLYIGHTTNFAKRKVQHKSNCYNENISHYNLKLYSTIRENGGWDAFNMVVIKEFPCENKQEARTEEDRIMRETQSRLNMRRSYLTQEEIIELRRKIYQKQYEKNREQIKEKTNKHYHQNKLQINEKRKNNYENNKDIFKEYHIKNKVKLNERSRKYYYQNIDKLNEKHNCPCGGRYTHQHKASHFKSKKHQTFINQQTDQ